MLQDIYGKIEEGKDPFKLNVSQAMEFYYDLFEIETSSKLDSEREHVAFLIAFYFLKFPNTIEEKDDLCVSYLKIYNYFKMVETMLLSEYLIMRQEEYFYEKHEEIIHKTFKAEYDSIQCFVP
jgi:hypothetical protein